jgi:DNA-binding FadR family transcriptional regulator
MTVPTPTLTIEIDRQHQSPIYLQICERFRTAIAAGHLRPGDRVPALRSLATQLNTDLVREWPRAAHPARSRDGLREHRRCE